MKKIFLMSAVFATVTLAASAQTQESAPATAPAQQQPRGNRGGNNLEQMTKELNLTADQQATLKKNSEEMRAKMDALRNEASLSDADKRAKRQELMEEQKTKTEAVLTAEQKTKWEAMRKKQMEERAQRGGGERPNK